MKKFNVKIPPKYVIGNKTYNSIEEIPENMRGFFEDKNKDGLPDVLQGPGTEITIDGKTFQNWDEVPQEDREALAVFGGDSPKVVTAQKTKVFHIKSKRGRLNLPTQSIDFRTFILIAILIFATYYLFLR